MTVRYAVETCFYGDNWENCWSVDDRPMTFATREEAQAELDEHLADCAASVADGAMGDAPTAENFRIVETTDELLRVDDGTLDAFIAESCKAQGVDLDDKSADWGGVFGIFFSGDDAFNRTDAEKLFADAVAYGRALNGVEG